MRTAAPLPRVPAHALQNRPSPAPVLCPSSALSPGGWGRQCTETQYSSWSNPVADSQGTVLSPAAAQPRDSLPPAGDMRASVMATWLPPPEALWLQWLSSFLLRSASVPCRHALPPTQRSPQRCVLFISSLTEGPGPAPRDWGEFRSHMQRAQQQTASALGHAAGWRLLLAH